MEAEEVESYNIELREEGDIKVVACSKNEGNCEGGKVCWKGRAVVTLPLKPSSGHATPLQLSFTAFCIFVLFVLFWPPHLHITPTNSLHR